MTAFAQLLAHPGVVERMSLRGRVGFMAYHGGNLEVMTDVIAERAASTPSGSRRWGEPRHRDAAHP